jgi:hypothetical protein
MGGGVGGGDSAGGRGPRAPCPADRMDGWIHQPSRAVLPPPPLAHHHQLQLAANGTKYGVLYHTLSIQ